jgi:HNH endonuclease
MKEKLSNKDRAIQAGIKDPAVVKRFKSKLMPQPNGCIEFKSAMWDKRDTYRRFGITWYLGDISINDCVKAHRFAWALEKGFDALPIAGKFSADSKVINHICGNKRCVNVDHLNVLTSRENLLPENHGKK